MLRPKVHWENSGVEYHLIISLNKNSFENRNGKV